MSKNEPSAGAMRAAEAILWKLELPRVSLDGSLAQIIDEHTCHKELLKALKQWVSIQPQCFCSDVIACPGCEAKQAIAKAEEWK